MRGVAVSASLNNAYKKGMNVFENEIEKRYKVAVVVTEQQWSMRQDRSCFHN